MNPYVFIAFVIVGASLLATGLIVLSAVLSSRASAQLSARHPKLHQEDWPAHHSTAAGDSAQSERPTIGQAIIH